LADFVPGSDCREDLVELAQFRHRLDLLMSHLAATLTETRVWDDDGYTTPIQWLREEAKLPTGVACQHVGVGLSLGSVPRSVEALERGEIGFGHRALIVDTSSFYREGSFDEAAFLEKAREQNVSQFRKTCEHARHAQDPRGFAESERERHERRFLKLSPQEDGAVAFRGWLDPEGGSLLRSALEPLARKAGVGDDRTREQRLAAALVEATTGDHQTELVVTCTLETLEGRAGSPAAETEWGGLLSGETVERLVCGGASLRRLVLDGDGVVIDFGRRRRLLSNPGAASAGGARQALRVAGVRSTTALVRLPSPARVAAACADLGRGIGPPLWPPPQAEARWRLAAVTVLGRQMDGDSSATTEMVFGCRLAGRLGWVMT